jgi:Protein of unknown function (DUF4236)
MSWRFRKSFKVFPGVKLNLTRNGISATLGAVPFSVNVGSQGVYGNVSIPGTGIWNRVRLDAPSQETHADGTLPGPPLSSFTSSPIPVDVHAMAEIRSASTEHLGSTSMENVRNLLKEAYDERSDLANEMGIAEREANFAAARFRSWDHGLLLKRMFKQSFASRKEASEIAQAKLDELKEQLRLTTVATEIEVDAQQAEPYYRMRDDFAALSDCQKIWDTLERRSINRVAERSAADEIITREPVSFLLSTCDLIQWEQKVPYLQNRGGGTCTSIRVSFYTEPRRKPSPSSTHERSRFATKTRASSNATAFLLILKLLDTLGRSPIRTEAPIGGSEIIIKYRSCCMDI